ncbi:MAG: hypothetical protein ACREE7_14730 [Dongiaceae bacterium]
MRAYPALLLALAVVGCSANPPAPPPPVAARQPGQYDVLRQGDFARPALSIVACVAGPASGAAAGKAIVVGDTKSVAGAYPDTVFPDGGSAENYVAVALRDRNDTAPLWAVVGHDTAGGGSHIELTSGYDAAGAPLAGPDIWRAVEACAAQV